MKQFGGPLLFLNRSNINTDEIIPARYLTENSKKALQPYLLEDLQITGFDPKRDISGKAAIITRANFGCGSSREHAPWALETNGINLVIAPSFARIFRQNMYNCGMLAIELETNIIENLFTEYSGTAAAVSCDIENAILHIRGSGRETRVSFNLRGFERALIEAGGWVEYAAARY